MMILSEFVLTMSLSPEIQDAVVLRRIGTASLIELRAPHGLGEHVTAATAHTAGDSLCIYQQLGAGSRFSGNPEFCIHHGMFATSYSDLPYETAPLAAGGFTCASSRSRRLTCGRRKRTL